MISNFNLNVRKMSSKYDLLHWLHTLGQFGITKKQSGEGYGYDTLQHGQVLSSFHFRRLAFPSTQNLSVLNMVYKKDAATEDIRV